MINRRVVWLLVFLAALVLVAVGVAGSVIVSGANEEKATRTKDVLTIWIGNNGIVLYLFFLALVAGLLILLPIFAREAQKLTPLVQPVAAQMSNMARSVEGLVRGIGNPLSLLANQLNK